MGQHVAELHSKISTPMLKFGLALVRVPCSLEVRTRVNVDTR